MTRRRLGSCMTVFAKHDVEDRLDLVLSPTICILVTFLGPRANMKVRGASGRKINLHNVEWKGSVSDGSSFALSSEMDDSQLSR